MSRIANKPIALPSGVEVNVNGQSVTIKAAKGSESLSVHPDVTVANEDGLLKISANDDKHVAMAGTMRALLQNVVTGVTTGFEKKMKLVGVGYRAQAQGQTLNLSLGFSHPVAYAVPEGIKVETPSQTEIIISGSDKQKVGQVAAEIRAYRPPEPYKGKGVRYENEEIILKETKKA